MGKDEYPTKRDGLVYTDETYLACISDPKKCHQPDIDNYQKIISEVKACDKINRGEIDELYLLPIMGFSYEREEIEMLENFAHRMEATMIKVYRSWDANEKHTWNRFSLLDVDKPGRGGCGNAHLAVNAGKNTGYDQVSMQKVASFCEDFLNYPNLTNKQTLVSCLNWGCTSYGYLKWWFKHIPRFGGKDDGIFNNWWIYISNPQSALE